jgi:hypothetical protein
VAPKTASFIALYREPTDYPLELSTVRLRPMLSRDHSSAPLDVGKPNPATTLDHSELGINAAAQAAGGHRASKRGYRPAR